MIGYNQHVSTEYTYESKAYIGQTRSRLKPIRLQIIHVRPKGFPVSQTNLTPVVKTFSKDQKGATSIEYAVLASVLGILAITVLPMLTDIAEEKAECFSTQIGHDFQANTNPSSCSKHGVKEVDEGNVAPIFRD